MAVAGPIFRKLTAAQQYFLRTILLNVMSINLTKGLSVDRSLTERQREAGGQIDSLK
jgi:hypothetical protein